MATTLPIEMYEAFEKTLGKAEAKAVVKGLEAAISENTEYKWKTTKDELLNDIEKRFATKADLLLLETKMRADLADTKTELLKWMFIFWASQIGIIVALIKFLK